VVIGEMFILKSPGPFLALPFPHLNPRGVVLLTRPSYYPRGTCPRWADTPAAPGRAESLSRQFLALMEFVEMVRLPCQVGHLRCLVGHLHCHVRTLRCRMGRVRLRRQWLEGGSRREVLSGQVEAEQGVKQKAKPKAKPNKTQKQIQMQAGWLPRVEHAGSSEPRTRSRGLEINYLDDHRTNPAEERRRRILAEESRREEEELRDSQDYMHTRWRAGPTGAQQEAEQEADWSFESATSEPALQGWQSDSGQEGLDENLFTAEPGNEADFFTEEAGHLSEMLGAHAEGLTRLGLIDEAEEDKQLADLGIQTDPGEVRQVLQLRSTSTSTRRRGRSGGLPTDAGALDHFSLPHLAQEYKQRKKKVQSGTGKSIP
jgi:hypothetical protein